MFTRLLSFFGMHLPELAPSNLLKDKLVLLALPPRGLTPELLKIQGAIDVLVLSKDGPLTPERCENHVSKLYTRLKDVCTNNCEIAILNGQAPLVLNKHKFNRFNNVLIPFGWPGLLATFGIIHYYLRGYLSFIGKTHLLVRNQNKTYLVLSVTTKPREVRRQYGPSGLSPLEILKELSDINQVVLRRIEEIEAGIHTGDIDILISTSDIDRLKARLGRVVGTYPLDVYTDDGSKGYSYNSVPYYTLPVAQRILDSAIIDRFGVRIPSPFWRYLSYSYHLLFHDKSARIRPGQQDIRSDTFQSPHNFEELQRLAALASCPAPKTFEEIETLLKNSDAFPSLDLIGFYSNKNAFLKKRYFDQKPNKPGLATFFIRDFGQGLSVVPDIRSRIESHFTILTEGPVTEQMREAVIKGVRGGNWVDPEAPGGLAEPIYWLVCWDKSPRSPSRRTRRKHPRVDNEHIRLKDEIRSEFGKSARKIQRLVHSSDNTLEALDHLAHLGQVNHPAVHAHLPANDLAHNVSAVNKVESL